MPPHVSALFASSFLPGVAISAVLTACGPGIASGSGEDTDSTTDAVGTASATDAETPQSSTTSTADPTNSTSSGSSSTSGEGSTGPATACGELDILFVVDNSGSMLDEQGRLGTALPGLINGLTAAAGSDDPHVMVVDVDAWVFEQCELLCSTFDNTCPAWEAYECGTTQPGACEDVLGAGVVHPQGMDASNEDCGFSSGGRYVDGSQPDLLSAVSCALQVGTGSVADKELPMQAMVEALDHEDALTCNDGFLRDDAILVVVFITDEDDGADDSAGEPLGWHSRVVAAKQGASDDVFVLGLFGDNADPDALCDDPADGTGAEASPRMEQFIGLWGEHGLRGSVCANDYSPDFAELVDTVAEYCG